MKIAVLAGDGTPVFTVFIAGFPIGFAGGLQGARTLEKRWRDLADAYRLPWHMRIHGRFRAGQTRFGK